DDRDLLERIIISDDDHGAAGRLHGRVPPPPPAAYELRVFAELHSCAAESRIDGRPIADAAVRRLHALHGGFAVAYLELPVSDGGVGGDDGGDGDDDEDAVHVPRLIFSFRGSTNPLNWIVNARFSTAPFSALAEHEPFRSGTVPVPRVHRG